MRNLLFPMALAALLPLAAAPAAHAQRPARPLTLWAAPAVSLGDTRHDLDYSVGIDLALFQRGQITLGASAGYVHALTADAGNVHRFPMLALAHYALPRLYVGAGLGVLVSDEDSPALGITGRTQPAFALLVGRQLPQNLRVEARFTASERPRRDGIFQLSLGVRF